MPSHRLIPASFEPPSTVLDGAYVIRPLRMEDAVIDHESYMSCVDYLRTGGFIQPPDTRWVDFPRHDMTVRTALALLRNAEHQMAAGERVEYGVFNLLQTRSSGCIYVLPSHTPRYDAMVTFWVREADHGALDAPLYALLRAWMPLAYPMFKTIGYPGRELSWDDWLALPRH
jgi:hypothetical protein